MRYHMETYIENNCEYIKIIPSHKDFEDFLTYKLARFPLYITRFSSRKWLNKMEKPVIITDELPGSQPIVLNEPICFQFNVSDHGQGAGYYREQFLDLLTEWLEDSLVEFQMNWRAMAGLNTSDTVDLL